MGMYKKKPVVIEAIQLTNETFDKIVEWIGAALVVGVTNQNGVVRHLNLKTLEGTMTADPGDWIIKGVKGEFYPCKPDIFALSYEVAE